jgi:predicted CXXCH cytochrome family protein
MAHRFWHWLSFFTILVLPILPIGYLALRQWQSMEVLFLPGSLASVHQHLECSQCHVEPWRGWRRVSGGDRQTGAIMDRACAHCHGSLPDAPVPILAVDLRQGRVTRPQIVAPHHPRQIPAEVGNCSDCHQEHQGDKGLVHVTEDQCRRCHSDLRTVDGGHTFYSTITAFDTDHPPFGRWRAGGLQDSGALRFNHQLHLCLDGKALRHLDEPMSYLKRQECSFCHQPDARGAHMIPIRYDKHCAMCHPLAVQIVARTNDLRSHEAAKTFSQEPAPHLAPDLVRAILRERLRLLAQRTPTIFADVPTPLLSRYIPGRRPDPLAPHELSGWIDTQADTLGRFLFEAPGGCLYCHIDKKAASHNGALPEYERTNIAGSWFPYATFSHARHSLMQCGTCHEKARTSSRTADVLMPLRSKCVECHNNQMGPAVRARADCLECHRYHGVADEVARAEVTSVLRTAPVNSRSPAPLR